MNNGLVIGLLGLAIIGGVTAAVIVSNKSSNTPVTTTTTNSTEHGGVISSLSGILSGLNVSLLGA